jgi:hypothetical protein
MKKDRVLSERAKLMSKAVNKLKTSEYVDKVKNNKTPSAKPLQRDMSKAKNPHKAKKTFKLELKRASKELK